jgi:hypothetical protein
MAYACREMARRNARSNVSVRAGRQRQAGGERVWAGLALASFPHSWLPGGYGYGYRSAYVGDRF